MKNLDRNALLVKSIFLPAEQEVPTELLQLQQPVLLLLIVKLKRQVVSARKVFPLALLQVDPLRLPLEPYLRPGSVSVEVQQP